MNDLTKLSDADLRVRVAEVVKLRGAATKGPWNAQADGFTVRMFSNEWEPRGERICIVKLSNEEDGLSVSEAVANQAFIASAHTQTDLLQELARRLEGAERALSKHEAAEILSAFQHREEPSRLTWQKLNSIAHAGAHKEGQTDE